MKYIEDPDFLRQLYCAALTGLLADPEDHKLLEGKDCPQSTAIYALNQAEIAYEEYHKREDK